VDIPRYVAAGRFSSASPSSCPGTQQELVVTPVFTLSALATSVSYTAAAVGCVIAVPQVVRLVRTRETAGVSVGSWEVNTLSAMAWLSYGVRTQQGPHVGANLCTLLGGLAVLWLVLEPGAQRRSGLTRFSASAGVVGAAVLLLPSAWLTLPLAATGLFSRVPQMRATAVTWWSRRPSGVAASAWALAVVCSGLWLCAGLLTGQAAVVWSSAIACATAALILAAETWPRPGGWASLEELDAEAAALRMSLERPRGELVAA
jgi:MtN3 and saliva related transmembrane protein